MSNATSCWVRRAGIALMSWAISCAWAEEYTGPASWVTVSTNGVEAWNSAQRQSAPSSRVKAWPGVVADLSKGEVRLLAEAVGHRAGITTEFLLVGPLSDRAYESLAVTVARPGDLVRALECLGVPRGGGVGSRPFRFWPYGERVSATVRRLDVPGQAERPIATLVQDAETESPMLGAGGLVFTGGRWAADACLSETNMPASVISLYNEAGTIFDVPFQVGQSDVYGRLTVAEIFPCGALLEFVFRPMPAPGGGARAMPLSVTASMEGDTVKLSCAGADGAVCFGGGLAEVLKWLRGQSEAGRDLFVTLSMDDAMPLKHAADVARVFGMIEGKGIKFDGKSASGLYPRAFLPSEKWRDRKERTVQPFELHLSRGADGSVTRKLVVVEEDWNVEGLDPKLTPKDYPFEQWQELSGLVEKNGGPDNKSAMLFVFAPADLPLAAFMPGVRALDGRLPLVYVFSE